MQTVPPLSTDEHPQTITRFYDQYVAKHLKDFVFGNQRVDAALACASAHIRPDTCNILDVGCGIGVSSHYYSSNYPWASVDGVDISPRNIEIARSLFGQDRVSFSVSAMSAPPTDRQYDVITLIDVYEHVPLDRRGEFDDSIAACLSDYGTVILTTPTRLHQEYLKTQKPEGLQVVDETISLMDIHNLANVLRADVICYTWESVWNSYDYVHVVLRRSPTYTPIGKKKSSKANGAPWKRIFSGRKTRRSQDRSRGVEERRRLVSEKLGIEIR